MHFQLYRVIPRRCSLSAFRGVWLLTVLGLGLTAGSARAEDFEAGKTGAKIFESDCMTCHRSPRGLAKGMGSHALVDFLREHYTTGLGPANELADYLESGAADGDDRHAPKTTGEGHAGDQHQHAQTVVPPTESDTDQSGPPVRKRHRAGSTPQPEATSESDAAVPPPPPHKRHHARSSQPPNEGPLPANAAAGASSDVPAPPDETPQHATPRETRHKHQRSPKASEPSQTAKQQPETIPPGSSGGTPGAEPGQAGSEKEPAAVPGAGGDHAPNPPVHANREAPPDAAAEPGSNAGSAPPPVAVPAPETSASLPGESPSSAPGSSNQPAFSSPSP